MTSQTAPMTRAHLEAVRAAMVMLEKHAKDIASEPSCSSDGSVERSRAKRTKEARKPIRRLSEVAAHLAQQIGDSHE